MASTSTNRSNPPPPLLFDLLLRSSINFMVSNPRDATSSSLFLLNISTACITKSHIEDLIQTLKYLFNQALVTHQVATKEEVDPATTLATLKSLMAAISRTTHHSSESIAQSALEHLHQLSLHSQELQKKLTKYNSRASYLMMTSTVVGGFATFALPLVGFIPVQPLPQLFSSLWKERMINALGEKLKLVEDDRFMIHSMIIKVGKMKDMVQALVSLVAKHEDTEHHEKLLEELDMALVEALTHVKMVELELEIGYLS